MNNSSSLPWLITRNSKRNFNHKKDARIYLSSKQENYSTKWKQPCQSWEPHQRNSSIQQSFLRKKPKVKKIFRSFWSVRYNSVEKHYTVKGEVTDRRIKKKRNWRCGSDAVFFKKKEREKGAMKRKRVALISAKMTIGLGISSSSSHNKRDRTVFRVVRVQTSLPFSDFLFICHESLSLFSLCYAVLCAIHSCKVDLRLSE